VAISLSNDYLIIAPLVPLSRAYTYLKHTIQVRGRRFELLDDSSEVQGVSVYHVSVGKASHILEALNLLRQQLVMAELYASCWTQPEPWQAGEATTHVHISDANADVHMMDVSRPPHATLVEISGCCAKDQVFQRCLCSNPLNT
jgi:hypothetical protein